MQRLSLNAEFYHSTSNINNGLLRAPPAAPPLPVQPLQVVNTDVNPFAAFELNEDEHGSVDD